MATFLQQVERPIYMSHSLPYTKQLSDEERASARAEREKHLPRTRNDYSRHYGRWHDQSDEHFDVMTRIFERRLAPYVDPSTDPAVLEIGCGMGFCLSALRKLGVSNVIGIDSDQGQIAAATARSLPAVHVPIPSFPAFAQDHREKFDLILLFDVFEHIPISDQGEFLREILSLLRPNGMVVMQVPNANSIVNGRFRYIDATHHSSFTESSLDFLLYSAGFEDIEIRESDKVKKPSSYKWSEWRNWFEQKMARHIIRRLYGAEIGRDAWIIPLSGNITASARRKLG